jgi:hypothetical protein
VYGLCSLRKKAEHSLAFIDSFLLQAQTSGLGDKPIEFIATAIEKHMALSDKFRG